MTGQQCQALSENRSGWLWCSEATPQIVAFLGARYARPQPPVEKEKELEALRRSVQRGRPYGTPEWQKKIAKRLGLESSYRSAGRPPKMKRRCPPSTP